jgi:hypothetical protein
MPACRGCITRRARREIRIKLAHLKFYNYDNIIRTNSYDFDDYEKIILPIEGLEKILKCEKGNLTLTFYDLVIIDGIMKIFNNFANQSNKNKAYPLMTLCNLFSKKILIMDTDVNIEIKNFVKNIGESIFINNNYK